MLTIQTLDRKIWRKDLLLVYLHECKNKNIPAVISLCPEGPCATAMGLYRLLDEFCTLTNYPKSWITVETGNLIEQHPEYTIIKDTENWFEVKKINKRIDNNEFVVVFSNTPTKHFGNFVSRGNWFRLWIAAILDKKYSSKTLQTYHYDPNKENYNANGYIGVDDLFRFDCDIVLDVVHFLQTCPRLLDIDYLQNLENIHKNKFHHPDSYYPIQHPNNLNLVYYYHNIFVDIVTETVFSGDSFFISEKTWRPIITKRPFIIMSNRNFLANFKRLGFKTFDQWWDESYDLYSGQDRIKQVERILEVIATWTLEELSVKLLEMHEVLEHNYNVFRSLNYDVIKEKLEL
jgi:hypothetical protein